MNKKHILLNIAAYASISLSIVIIVYFVNILLFSSSEIISPSDALFIEGIISLVFGFLLFLGRGGINLWSQRAAIISAAADAAYGADTVGPSEVMRRDAWKSKGFTRIGLILVITGVLLLAAYFLTL